MKRSTIGKLITGMLVVCALFTSGCIYNYGRFSVLSNKALDLFEFELDSSAPSVPATGTVSVYNILLIPTGEIPTFEEAITVALKKGNGDVMTNATAQATMWGIPAIFWKHTWTVEGQVTKTRKR